MPILLARLVLAAVFGVAAWAKLTDPRGTRQSMVDFGVPAGWAPAFGVLVPVAEIGCAVALVRTNWAWWGAVSSIALLGAFMLAIAVNMVLGRKPDCRCFGQLQTSRIGWPTLGRNGVLAGLAAFVAMRGPGDTGPDLMTALNLVRESGSVVPAVIVIWLVVVVVAGVWLYRTLPEDAPGHHPVRAAAAMTHLKAPSFQQAAVTPAQEELAVDTLAPPFALASLHGLTVTLDDLRQAGQPVLLVFTRPNCPPCESVLPDVGRWQREHADRLVVMPVSKNGVDANREKATMYDLLDVLIQEDDEVSDAYGVQILPSGVLVTDGRIACPYAEGTGAIRALVERTTSPAAP